MSGGRSNPSLFGLLGPGILFAGAAIGVSHLIQSTRAGAVYGLALIPVMLLVHALKYPGLSAGARYAGATGRSILSGYRRLGPISFGAAVVAFFLTALPIQAAVANVTAAVLVGSVGAAAPGAQESVRAVPVWAWAGGLQVLAAAIAFAGGFRWLDRVMKVIMACLALMTIAAAALVLPRVDLSTANPLPPALMTGAGLTFLLAFLGWMPAPMDVAMWSSHWCVAKQRGLAERPPPKLIKAEFLIGYAKCIVLAAAFIVLGAGLIYAPGDGGSGVVQGGGIVGQLIASYGEALSPAVVPVVAVCAFGVMFSTLLSSTDAIPRIAMGFIRREDANAGSSGASRTPGRGSSVLAASVLVVLATLVLWLTQLRAGSFLVVVDFATVVSFLMTPVLAVLHHRILCGDEMPAGHGAAAWERRLSRVAIVLFTAFAAVYLVTFVLGKLGG